ncbi:hypothetical protein CL634_03285 [bacterium]|nr:hypothetical protein [bacterium]
MLEQLFGSKARALLLRHFLNHNGTPFYLRQLARELGLQLNSVRREVINLEKFGIVSSQEPAESEDAKTNIKSRKKPKTAAKKSVKAKLAKKFYTVNEDFLLYPELRALMVKSQLLTERKLIDKIVESGRIKYFVLTGSFVNDGTSPTDMLVVGTVNRKKLASLLKKFEKELGRAINYTVMTTQEFKYRQDVTDVFLYSVLEGKKMVIVDELTS